MRNEKAKVGDLIKITSLKDPFDSTYEGRIGRVEIIDSLGQLHGTWGGLAVIPEVDSYIILNHA